MTTERKSGDMLTMYWYPVWFDAKCWWRRAPPPGKFTFFDFNLLVGGPKIEVGCPSRGRATRKATGKGGCDQQIFLDAAGMRVWPYPRVQLQNQTGGGRASPGHCKKKKKKKNRMPARLPVRNPMNIRTANSAPAQSGGSRFCPRGMKMESNQTTAES